MEGLMMAAVIGAIAGTIAVIFFVGGCIYGWWNQKRQGPVHKSMV